jgi:hypothetical protein
MAAAQMERRARPWPRQQARAIRIPASGERVTGDEIDEVIALTFDGNPQIRGRAVKRLCPCHVQANEARVWDRVIALADDPDPYVRAQVLHALGDGSPRVREAEVVATVERLRDDPDPHLRRRVRRLLAEYRRTGRINIL